MPHESVIRPVLFNIMIIDIFVDVEQGIGTLWADDEALWTKGRDVPFVKKKFIKDGREMTHKMGC